MNNSDSIWPVGKVAAFYTIGIVFLLQLLDYGDRQLLVSIFPIIKEQWHLSDTQLGMIPTAITMTVALLTVFSASLIDRWSRKKMIVIMGCIWAISIGMCSFATCFAMLLFFRIPAGAGESAYTPAVQALAAAQFPKKHLGKAIMLTTMGLCIGNPFGLIVGAYVIENWGWHHVLGLFAIPGLIIALLGLKIKDYKTIAISSGNERGWKQIRSAFKLLCMPSLFCIYVGMILVCNVIGVGTGWLPSYFTRVAGLPLSKAHYLTAGILIASSVAIILLGPCLDRLLKKYSNAGPALLCCGALFGGICYVIAYGFATPGSTLQIICQTAGSLGIGSSILGVPVSIIRLVHPGVRATAISFQIMLQSLLGLAVSPVLTGLLSDLFGLGTAMFSMHCFMLAGAVFFGVSILFYKKDLARFEHQEVSFNQ